MWVTIFLCRQPQQASQQPAAADLPAAAAAAAAALKGKCFRGKSKSPDEFPRKPRESLAKEPRKSKISGKGIWPQQKVSASFPPLLMTTIILERCCYNSLCQDVAGKKFVQFPQITRRTRRITGTERNQIHHWTESSPLAQGPVSVLTFESSNCPCPAKLATGHGVLLAEGFSPVTVAKALFDPGHKARQEVCSMVVSSATRKTSQRKT